jgi:cysteinyl-tRNA synthetase
MAFEGEISAAIGNRVSIRLLEKAGAGASYRDLLGVLQDETTVVKRDGSLAHFDPNEIAFFRVVPVFNRRDSSSANLALYDTRDRAVEEIAELETSVTVYCCGPTVYRDAHVGNMRTFLLADLAVRALELAGHETMLIQNITDVGHMTEDIAGENEGGDDKVVEEGRRQSLTALEIAQKYEAKFHSDLALLNIRPADKYPRASESMDLIIASIEKLVEVGAAYIGSDSNVYYDAQRFESYGAISGNKLDQLKPGHRYEYTGDGGKKFHADWALWKVAADRSEMVWPSPWGTGFPGWHIECSAMSLHYLGDSIDLHIGGIDLRFPHHENERAQTNSLAGHDVVKHWLHGEHLLFEGRKMSKSAGNVVLVNDLIAKGLDPLALRLALMENRYRSQMDLTWDSLSAADATLRRWRSCLTSWGVSMECKFDLEINSFIMNDLDLPKVLIRLRNIERDKTIGEQDKRALFLYADQVLGLDLNRPLVLQSELTGKSLELFNERATARASGNWSESDRLRDELALLNIEVRDSKDGQSWVVIS